MGFKRRVYIALATLLGIIASYGVHAAVELWYLRWAQDNGHVITWTKHFGLCLCALPPVVQYGLFVLGAVGGFLAGRVWWRWVYVEGRHWKRKKSA